MIKKLFKKGFRYKCLKLIANTFCNRKEIIKFLKIFSEEIKVNSGVFQGSKLSPTLFALYMSDISNGINSDLKQFADDTLLIKLIYQLKDTEILQSDINQLCKWTVDNDIKLNPQKSKHLRITLKKCNDLPKYKINSDLIETVEEHEHLGFILDSKLSFNSICNKLVSKAYKKWFLLRYLCSKVDGNVFLRLYKTYILLILEFCNIVWLPNKSQSNRLEKVPKKVTKFIAFKLNKSNLNYSQSLKELGLKSLHNRASVEICTKNQSF